MSISLSVFPFFVKFLNSTLILLLFLPHRSVSVTCCSFCAPHLDFVYSFVLHSYNQGWLATHFILFYYYFFVVASPALVVGMHDNTQVGDAGGLFKSLDPALCGTVPAYLIQCSSSSLPDPVLRFQSTSSSASDPVYTSSTAAVPVYLIQCSGFM